MIIGNKYWVKWVWGFRNKKIMDGFRSVRVLSKVYDLSERS